MARRIALEISQEMADLSAGYIRLDDAQGNENAGGHVCVTAACAGTLGAPCCAAPMSALLSDIVRRGAGNDCTDTCPGCY